MNLISSRRRFLIHLLPASIFIVNVDNVGSNQMHQIRVALRGQGVVLMGKNTMVRRALRILLSELPQFERLMPHIRGNIGFVFTSGDLKEIRTIITSNTVAAPARAGALAPIDVTVPAGNTGMEPGKTSFFQALQIPTKIARGTIEIVADVKVVFAGTRVGPSEATLLNMMNISPFTYGMTVVQIYQDGNVFAPEVLDIDSQELIDRFLSGIKTIAAIALALNYPTIVSVVHELVNAYKRVLGVSLATDYSFEASAKVSIVFCFRYSLLRRGPPMILKYPTENSEYLTGVLRINTCSLGCLMGSVVMSHVTALDTDADHDHDTSSSRRSSRIPKHSPLPLLRSRRLPLPKLLPKQRRRQRRRRNLTMTWVSVCSTKLLLYFRNPTSMFVPDKLCPPTG